jgi:hypothetical protein
MHEDDQIYTVPASKDKIVKKAWLAENQNTLTPPADRRPPDQTFLTYPEWFLVHSPAEQAAYFQTHTATTFPFLTHIDQIWDSYTIVSKQIEDAFPYNDDYHLMIKVIGVSATIEYALKAWYEKVIGRLTDTDSDKPLTQEDLFNCKLTQEYVDFIRTTPWYEFDFQEHLINLWSNTSFFGPNFFRKLERKYLLTSELLVKAVYAKLIKMGTATIYEEALLSTVVLVDTSPDENNDDPIIKILNTYENGSALLRLPRYAAFTPAAVKLANSGIDFIEIAGNDSAILLTVLVGKNSDLAIDSTQRLFVQPLPSSIDEERVALVTTVPELSEVLRQIVKREIKIEHIYDY